MPKSQPPKDPKKRTSQAPSVKAASSSTRASSRAGSVLSTSTTTKKPHKSGGSETSASKSAPVGKKGASGNVQYEKTALRANGVIDHKPADTLRGANILM